MLATPKSEQRCCKLVQSLRCRLERKMGRATFTISKCGLGGEKFSPKLPWKVCTARDLGLVFLPIPRAGQRRADPPPGC